MVDIQNEWSKEWTRFFKNTHLMVKWKVQIRRDVESAGRLVHLIAMATKTLVSEKTLAELGSALEDWNEEADGAIVLEMLLSEIIYISDKIERRLSSEPETPVRSGVFIERIPQQEVFHLTTSAPSGDEELDDAKTGKDSLENILGKKFSKGTKGVLKIVNEVLSLAKGGF